MIVIHRLAHEDEPLHLNPDLIATIEHTPDTVITLTTGHKIVAGETPEEIVGRIREFRVGLLSDALAARRPERAPADGPIPLHERR